MPGKYKGEMNDTECKSCFTGKYSATNCATTENVCQQCPLNSNSTSGSIQGTDCKCNPGSNGQDGGPCDLCISGKFKVESANETCTSYEIGKISQNVGGITDHVCQQCPPNSNSSYVGSQRQDCKCNPGFTGQDGGPCELCMPGKFKIAPGSDSCIDCMQGKYSQNFCGIAEHICQKCPSNSNSTISSTIQQDCKCNPGLTGQDGGPCSECAPGKYKVQHGNSTCTPCPIGTYYDNVGAKLEKDCKQCPSLSTSLHSSQKIEDCKCNSGSTGHNGGICSKCETGKYKIVQGSDICTNCSNGTYYEYIGSDLQTNCKLCPLYSNSQSGSNNLKDCTCNSGSTGQNGDICHKCETGRYKSQAGNETCISCANGTFSNIIGSDTIDICQKCPLFSYSTLGQNCTCNPGWSLGDDGNCNQCVAGKYKSKQSNIQCTNCSQGTHSASIGAVNMTACRPCQLRSNSPLGSDSLDKCQCNSGSTGESWLLCLECARGKYKSEKGNSSCISCETGKYAFLTGATHHNVCKQCPPHSKILL